MGEVEGFGKRQPTPLRDVDVLGDKSSRTRPLDKDTHKASSSAATARERGGEKGKWICARSSFNMEMSYQREVVADSWRTEGALYKK